MKQIRISDVTLKKLAEEKLLFRDKTAISICASSLGADTVELAPVKSIREDTIIYKTICQNVKDSAVAIPVGFTADDVKNAFECIKEAKSPRLQIELPVSTVQMEYIYHLKAEKMLSKISELVKEAKNYTNDVEFVALDATRADEKFLIDAIKEAEAQGATSVTISDDAGIALPEEIEALVKKIKAESAIHLNVQPSDKISMAVSVALSAVRAGADGIKCAMAGKDALLMGKISDAISTRGETIGAETKLQNTKIHANVDEMLSSLNHATYEEAVVSDKKKILLDKDTTLTEVSKAAMLLGYDLSDEDAGKVHRGLMQVCEKKDSIGSKELEALIASFAMQAPSTYHLESYTTSSSNITGSMSQVTLTSGDETLLGVSTGDGPIDSAFRAIEQCIGYHYELDDFQVQAVTEGKEALGSAIVRLRNKGKLYSGNGISTDIVAASIRAYINALNKIVYEGE
ncbi:MAG: hypothetical protein IJ323_05265 [Clostridia bacterium]|nr:hypothetical protein [Clostridia bacterium]MBQ7897817.1 hypothetical protein [Clostridia bacterium]